MNNNNISEFTSCMGLGCKVAEQCRHHQLYMEQKDHWLVMSLMNTTLIDITDEGCKYFIVTHPVMMARGFRAIYDSVPHSIARGLWKDFPRKPSRRQFYRLLSGQVLIEPDYQEEILHFFEDSGANIQLGFEKMEEVMVV